MKRVDARTNQRGQRQQQDRFDRQRAILKFLRGTSRPSRQQGDQEQHRPNQGQATALPFNRCCLCPRDDGSRGTAQQDTDIQQHPGEDRGEEIATTHKEQCCGQHPELYRQGHVNAPPLLHIITV